MSFLIRQLGNSCPLFPTLYHLSSANSFPKWQQEESHVTLTLNPTRGFLLISGGVLFPSGSFQGTKSFASVYVSSFIFQHTPLSCPANLELWPGVMYSRVVRSMNSGPNSPAESCMILSKLLNFLLSFISKTRAILVPPWGCHQDYGVKITQM